MYHDRVVVPPSLRDKVLRILHSAHQGVSSMEPRARYIVFWPGMTNDILAVREHCSVCNRSRSLTGQHDHKQPRPRSRRQSLQPRSNQYSQTFFLLLWLSQYCGWRPIRMGRGLQSSSWDNTSRCSGPNCSPQSTIRYVRCS